MEAHIEACAEAAEEALHASVDEEWSFVETLRHLVFATDAWVRRTILRERDHFYAGGLTHTDLPWWFAVACGIDPKADPSLEEVLAVRADRLRLVREVIDGLTPAELDRRCKGTPGKAYPTQPKRYTVRGCLWTVVSEEWEHHKFVVRDLDLLEKHPELASSKRPRTTLPKKKPPTPAPKKKSPRKTARKR